jgi:hypothetical protein
MPITDSISLLVNEFHTDLFPNAVQIMIYIAPIFLAVFLGGILWSLWMRYIRSKFYNSLKYAVLELKLPKETSKSPAAMEAVITGLHNTSDGGWVTKFWKGEYRPYYSLEIASHEGQVKYYIWTEDRRKGGLMNALYAQFPGIEIYDRGDYTQGVTFDPAVTKLWCAEFVLTKPDPYPIKTYIDFGLDKDPKEEFKVDPMLFMIEFLSSVPLNQHVWMQILIRSHKKEQRLPGHFMKKYDTWESGARDLVNTILGGRDPKTKVVGKVEIGAGLIAPRTSPGEEDVIKAIERSLHKHPFDVCIRCIYFAPKDQFNTPFGIGGCISSFKQFSSNELNGFKPNGEKWIAQFDEPWKDYRDMRRNHLSKEALKAYKRRSIFHPPYQGKTFVLNTEELATIYHFPGSVAASPGLERIPSKKAEAPANLPV